MLILLFVYAAILLSYVNDFYVPDSDFFDFRAKASAFRSLEMPQNLKRPPLYSITIALVSTFIPGQNRELYAAELINFVSAIGVVWLSYLITRQFLGPYAFLVAWLVATSPLAIKMAVKPKSEIFAAVLILAAFWSFLKKSKRAYLFAFLASMVRFEGALCIPAFALVDFAFRKNRWQAFILGGLALSFSLAWFFLVPGGDAESSGYQSYFNPGQIIQGFSFINSLLASLVGFLPLNLFRGWGALAIILMAAGLYACFRTFRADTVCLGCYFLLYLLLHLIWPFSIQDYIIMIHWLCYFLIVAGLLFGLRKLHLNKILAKNLQSRFFLITTVAMLTFTWIALAWKSNPVAEYQAKIWIVGLFLVPMIVSGWNLIRQHGLARWSGIAVLLIPATIIAWRSNAVSNTTMFDLRYAKAEFRQVGEWYQKHYQPGDKLFMLQPNIAAYYTQLNLESDFVSQADANVNNLPELTQWLAHRKVTYVAWVSHQKRRQTDDTWYQWRVSKRNLLLLDELSQGKSIENFTLIQELRQGPRWAYIYRLENLKSDQQQ